MGNLIGIVGPSGHGKTTSLVPNEQLGIKGLNPKETVIINVSGKPLPFKNSRKIYNPDIPIMEGGNYIVTENAETIEKAINFINSRRPDIKHIVIDDAGYTMGLQVISKAKIKGFDKWTDLAVDHMRIINAARHPSIRKDLTIILIYHQEKGPD